MIDAKEYLTQLLNYDKQIAEINKSRQSVIDNLLELVCPFKIGDVTECCGMAHRGKRMFIAKVMLKQNHHGNYFWLVAGPVLKKDGSETNRVADFTEMDWNLEKEIKAKERPENIRL